MIPFIVVWLAALSIYELVSNTSTLHKIKGLEKSASVLFWTLKDKGVIDLKDLKGRSENYVGEKSGTYAYRFYGDRH
jgi:hypothetical protein